MLNFFVKDSQLKDLKIVLKAFRFNVRSSGKARPNEIVIFYNKKQKGFYFAAHKLIEEELPEFALQSPFLVCVGENWTKRGLLNVLEGYYRFLYRGLPVFCFDYMTEEQILNICKRCVRLPWGGFPEKEKGKKQLISWLQEASNVL